MILPKKTLVEVLNALSWRTKSKGWLKLGTGHHELGDSWRNHGDGNEPPGCGGMLMVGWFTATRQRLGFGGAIAGVVEIRRRQQSVDLLFVQDRDENGKMDERGIVNFWWCSAYSQLF